MGERGGTHISALSQQHGKLGQAQAAHSGVPALEQPARGSRDGAQATHRKDCTEGGRQARQAGGA